jgi:DNA modification methylase/predicted RNA-binding Zn-ribbon protein involved in translation (DUF1610 family)
MGDFVSNEIKRMRKDEPIDHPVVAKPHTAVYKMHRYFARRPWNVFEHLIKHYSVEGDIILDPFCGGGVTVYEGLKLRRKVIGVDINPLATFITKCEVMPCDLEELQKHFKEIEKEVQDKINELYLTTCPKCGKEIPADWFEWSNVYDCPDCGKENIVSECEKLRAGTYKCKFCYKGSTTPEGVVKDARGIIKPLQCVRKPSVMINIFVSCPHCKSKGTKKPDKKDISLAQKIEDEFQTRVKLYKHLIPDDPFPDADRQRDDAVFQKGIKYFADLFTRRNLLANAILKSAIASEKHASPLLWLTFSANLSWTCILNEDVGHGWQRHAYWLADVSVERNVFRSFSQRYGRGQSATKPGKTQSNREIGDYAIEAQKLEDLKKDATYLILTQSAHKLPIPDNSIDVIISDPPYGGNVQYQELSAFWLVWLKEFLGINKINYDEEAIETRHSGFPIAKDHKHYREMLGKIFEECHRVLKPDGWMVMTFHNREFKVWNSIHLAAHDEGFALAEEDGMIYQPAIRLYEHTMHTKASGSMLGDFILSFKRLEELPEKKIIPALEVEKRIQQIAGETILHHGGATVSQIYTRAMPFLLNNFLLEDIKERDIEQFLKEGFYQKKGRWYLEHGKMPNPLEEHLKDYSSQHYGTNDLRSVIEQIPVEGRLEFLIRRLLLKNPGGCTHDEILREIYENLIDSNAAEMGEITNVLNRIAGHPEQGNRKLWLDKLTLEKQKRMAFAEEALRGVVKYSEESDHDLAIEKLVLCATNKYRCHIGRTEQKKYKRFQRYSANKDFEPIAKSLPAGVRKYVEEIDVVWFTKDGIVAAFEVEKSTTIHSGIDRFRNLFVAEGATIPQATIIIPGGRKREAEEKIGSPANRKESLTAKIGYILLDDLKITKIDEPVEINALRKKVS